MARASIGQVSLEIKKFLSHPQWPEVKSVIEKLRRSGFVAWLAGGCVRDALLKRTPQDFDIVTNATPDQVQRIFPQMLEVGKRFGISIIPSRVGPIEVATFRSDGDYKDGRHPEHVQFASPEEDAKRRDFSVNALFYDPIEDKIYDYVEGQKDLRLRLIRCVGDAQKRFQEDQLRLLRAVRFVSQLEFSIEPKTWREMAHYPDPLKNVSKERILAELNKIFKTHRPSLSLGLLARTHLWADIFPAVTASHRDHWDHVCSHLNQLAQQNAPGSLLWASVFEAAGFKNLEDVRDWLRHWPVSRDFTRETESIWGLLDQIRSKKQDEVEWAIFFEKNHLPVQFFAWVQIVFGYDSHLQRVADSFYRFYISRIGLSGYLPPPLVGGGDLLRLGIKKGPLIGDLLHELYKLQLKLEVENPQELLSSKLVTAYTSKEV